MTHWQKIEKNTLSQIRSHYLKFSPYCNLNVVDMWAYRGGPNYWFKLGDTIAYKLNDYMDNSYYLTVLGEESAKQTVQELCRQNKGQKEITLKCLPEETLQALGKWRAITRVKEDIDNHDYIFNASSLVDLNTAQAKGQYRQYRRLINKHPNLKIRPINIRKESERRMMYRVYKRWVAQTNPPDWHKEFQALKRALNLKLKYVNLTCIGVFDGQKMIGFTVNEAESNGYYQAFFGKGDRAYPGLGLFLEHETAKYMSRHFGSKYINLQPDSGIEGLRNFKQSLGPAKQLKKYIVTINTAKAIV